MKIYKDPIGNRLTRHQGWDRETKDFRMPEELHPGTVRESRGLQVFIIDRHSQPMVVSATSLGTMSLIRPLFQHCHVLIVAIPRYFRKEKKPVNLGFVVWSGLTGKHLMTKILSKKGHVPTFETKDTMQPVVDSRIDFMIPF